MDGSLPFHILAFLQSAPAGSSGSHRRRSLSSAGKNALGGRPRTISIVERESNPGLPSIADDQQTQDQDRMSLSRSPSPQPAGGWSTPGLSTTRAHSRVGTPKSYKLNGGNNVTWASAQEKSAKVNGYAVPANGTWGYIGKHVRKISASLPIFNRSEEDPRFAEKEKLGRGRWHIQGDGTWKGFAIRIGRLLWRLRLRLLIALSFLLFLIFCTGRKFERHSADTVFH